MVTFDFIGFLDELNPSAYFIKNCKSEEKKSGMGSGNNIFFK